MKQILLLFTFFIASYSLSGQDGSYQWILDAGCSQSSVCGETSATICYGLQYTPELSGTISSYTIESLTTCVNNQDPTSFNQTCILTDNSVFDSGEGDCAEFGDVYGNFSANNSATPSYSVTAGTPVIIHEVCFDLNLGESNTVDFTGFPNDMFFIREGSTVAETFRPTPPPLLTVNATSDCALIVLPVDLVNFQAERVQSQALLTWSTSSEVNNDFFEVQHSPDGKTWNIIGTVEGAGNSSILTSYSFVHHTPLNGNNYYRLRQVDYDASFEFSDVKNVFFSNLNNELSIIFQPNPAVDKIMISVNQTINDHIIQIRGIDGKIIRTQNFENGNFIDISNLNSGVYLWQIVDKSKSIAFQDRFIKIN